MGIKLVQQEYFSQRIGVPEINSFEEILNFCSEGFSNPDFHAWEETDEYQYCMKFPQFEHLDHNMPSWVHASVILPGSQSSLQSFSCSFGQKNLNSQLVNNFPEMMHSVEFQQNEYAQIGNTRNWSKCRLKIISFQKNHDQLEDPQGRFGHFHGGVISPASSNNVTKKKRIRWTRDLHNQFILCVNRLGGPKKATPKRILELMNCDGLTIFHIKSHLQKYRCAQIIPEYKQEISEKKAHTSLTQGFDIEMGMPIIETLRMQINFQRRLYEQLEHQSNLQLRIEEQAKELKKKFDREVETNSTSSNLQETS